MKEFRGRERKKEDNGGWSYVVYTRPTLLVLFYFILFYLIWLYFPLSCVDYHYNVSVKPLVLSYLPLSPIFLIPFLLGAPPAFLCACNFFLLLTYFRRFGIPETRRGRRLADPKVVLLIFNCKWNERGRVQNTETGGSYSELFIVTH